MRYIPHTEGDVRHMLEAIGVGVAGRALRQRSREAPARAPARPAARRERAGAVGRARGARGPQRSTETHDWFLGAGTYPHFIPSVVDAIASRVEFYTAYTPYQAEISQGTLQAIFEWQTMICALTGLEVSNASIYDGASATAEAALMAMRATRRSPVVLGPRAAPALREVVRTYLDGLDAEIVEAPRAADGRTRAPRGPRRRRDRLRDPPAAELPRRRRRPSRGGRSGPGPRRAASWSA